MEDSEPGSLAEADMVTLVTCLEDGATAAAATELTLLGEALLE